MAQKPNAKKTFSNEMEVPNPTPTQGGALSGPVAENEAAGDPDVVAAQNRAAEARALPAAMRGEGDAGLKVKIAKAAGVKVADVIGFSAYNQTIVTSTGGKYRLAPDGKSVLHLAGPIPPSQVED